MYMSMCVVDDNNNTVSWCPGVVLLHHVRIFTTKDVLRVNPLSELDVFSCGMLWWHAFMHSVLLRTQRNTEWGWHAHNNKVKCGSWRFNHDQRWASTPTNDLRASCSPSDHTAAVVLGQTNRGHPGDPWKVVCGQVRHNFFF